MRNIILLQTVAALLTLPPPSTQRYSPHHTEDMSRYDRYSLPCPGYDPTVSDTVWYDRSDLPTEEQMCTVGYDRGREHREDVLQYNLHSPDSLEEEIYLLRI